MSFTSTLKLSLVSLIGLLTASTTVQARPNVLTVNPGRLAEIIGEIGMGESQIAQAIHEVTNGKPPAPIFLSIQSPGGSVNFGMMIIDAMEQAKLRGNEFHCIVATVAASMAFQILAHCDHRYALPNANLLFHSVAIAGQIRLTPDEATYVAERLQSANKMLDNDLLKYMKIDQDLYLYHKSHETLWKPNELNQALGYEWIQIVNQVEGGVPNLFTFMKNNPMFFRGEVISIPSIYLKGTSK